MRASLDSRLNTPGHHPRAASNARLGLPRARGFLSLSLSPRGGFVDPDQSKTVSADNADMTNDPRRPRAEPTDDARLARVGLPSPPRGLHLTGVWGAVWHPAASSRKPKKQSRAL